MVELDVITMVAEVLMVKRGVPQPTVGHTCHEKYLGAVKHSAGTRYLTSNLYLWLQPAIDGS